MNIVSAHLFPLSSSAWKNGLNVEIVGPVSLLPNGRKCAIHFEADRTATIILGTRDYGQGFASTYFAHLLVKKLGIQFEDIRVYYTGMLPAVRRTPRQSRQVWNRSNVGVRNARIGDLIEGLCDCATDRGRRFLAILIGTTPKQINFDAASGRFFVAGQGQYFDILEVAKLARAGDVPAGVRREAA